VRKIACEADTTWHGVGAILGTRSPLMLCRDILFTIVLAHRQLLVKHIDRLPGLSRGAGAPPFATNTICILPDHLTRFGRRPGDPIL
jgi:hypothetical protein